MNRFNYVLMHGVLPFNFGMRYEDWVRLYENPSLRELVGSDPAIWAPDAVEAVNKRAAEEVALWDRLCKLPDEEFRAEVQRLSREARA